VLQGGRHLPRVPDGEVGAAILALLHGGVGDVRHPHGAPHPQRRRHPGALRTSVQDIRRCAAVSGALPPLLQPLPVALSVAGPGCCPPSPHGGRMLLPDPSKAAPGVHRALGAKQVGELGVVVVVRGGRQRFTPPPPPLRPAVEHPRLDGYASSGGRLGPGPSPIRLAAPERVVSGDGGDGFLLSLPCCAPGLPPPGVVLHRRRR
jgi:hypothetical protein